MFNYKTLYLWLCYCFWFHSIRNYYGDVNCSKHGQVLKVVVREKNEITELVKQWHFGMEAIDSNGLELYLESIYERILDLGSLK